MSKSNSLQMVPQLVAMGALLSADLNPFAGGVPLTLEVVGDRVRLTRLPRRAGVGEIVAWTTRASNQDPTLNSWEVETDETLGAVTAGVVDGVQLYSDTTIVGRAAGTPVYFRPASSALSLRQGEDGTLAGFVVSNQWALPAFAASHVLTHFCLSSEGVREYRLADFARTAGTELMVANPNMSGGVRVYGRRSTEECFLGDVPPGGAMRWRLEVDKDGRRDWQPSTYPVLVASVHINTHLLRDSEIMDAVEAIMARVAKLKDAADSNAK